MSTTTTSSITNERQITTKLLHQVTEKLATLAEDGFGPNALNSMLCTSSGKLLVTSSGATILKVVNVAHPVGHMVTRAVLSHCEKTGDGSKTFLFLLSGLLQHTHRLVNATMNDSVYAVLEGVYQVRHDILPNIVVPALRRVARPTRNVAKGKEICEKIIHTVLQGKMNVAGAQHFVKIISAMFADCHSMESIYKTAATQLEDFDLFCVENPGRPINSSILVKGLLIPRDFTAMHPDFPKQNPVHFLIVSCTLEQDLESDATFKISTAQQLALALEYNAKRVRKIAQILQKNGICLLFVAGKISRTSSEILQSYGISTVAYVLEEDAERLAKFCGILPIYDVDDLLDDTFHKNIGIAQKCMKLIVQQRKAMLLQGLCRKNPEPIVLPNPAQMIVTGPSNGVSTHLKQCVQCCLKAIVSAFDPEQVMESGLESGDSQHQRVVTYNTPSQEDENQQDDDNGQTNETNKKELCDYTNTEGSHDTLEGKTVQHSQNKENSNPHTAPTGQKSVNEKQTSSNYQMYTIPGGGAFEIQVYRTLNDYIENHKFSAKPSTIHVCQILRDAMLSVPLKLVKNSYASPVQRLSLVHIMKAIKDNGLSLVSVDAKLGNRFKLSETNGIIEQKEVDSRLKEMEKELADCRVQETVKKPADSSLKEMEKDLADCTVMSEEVHKSKESSKQPIRTRDVEYVHVSEGENKIIESLPSKMLLLYHMLEVYAHMLRIDNVVSVRQLPCKKVKDDGEGGQVSESDTDSD